MKNQLKRIKLGGLIIGFLIICSQAYSQQDKKLRYYVSTSDYIENNISAEFVIPKKVVYESSSMIKIPKLIDSETKKKSLKAGFPWAINIDSVILFNLRYSDKIFCPELYVKPDIIGRYCVIYANKEKIKEIHNHSIGYYGGGLGGAIIQESEKWGRNWENKENKVRIYILDTKKLEAQHMDGYKNAIWKILDKKNLNEILETEFSKTEINEISFEEIKEIITKKNNVG